MTILLAWLSNKWVQRGLMVAAIVAAILIARAYYIGVGKNRGAEEQKIASKSDVEASRTSDRSDAVQLLQQFQDTADRATARAQSAEALAVQLASATRELAQQRSAAADTVARVSDSDLHNFVVRSLAMRPAADATPGYRPDEERAIAQCVSEYPICKQQVEKQGQEIARTQEQVSALNEKIDALGGKYDALAGYTTRLERDYATIYNLFPQKRRAIQCVWLWHCKVVKLQVQNPKDLQSPIAVQTSAGGKESGK